MDVHRAARVAAAAHGGQVVLSSVTADLARPGLPDGVALRDLGIHQLKDIPAPDHLWQLDIEGLPAEFPPLRTIGATSRLPMTATRLVGRDDEAATLTGLLRDPAARLVTLTGPGGSGKTRLAIGLAERLMVDFPDGVYFVPLAAVTSADVMWTSIAEAVDVPPRRRSPGGLFEYLADRRALLVLDNLEQLPDADDVVAQLLAALPRAAVIATSRRALFLPGEYRHPVPPLELPDDSDPRAGIDVECRAALRRAGAADRASLPADRPQRRRRGGHLPPAGRAAAGHRARGLPGPRAQPAGPRCVASTRRSTSPRSAGIPRPDSGPCATPSPGPTTSWHRTSRRCSAGWGCSPVEPTWTGSPRSPPTSSRSRTRSRSSRRSSTSAW